MQNRERALVALLLALVVGSTAMPAGAASVADISVAVTANPTSVSPPGGIVLYRVTVTNNGPAPGAPADLVDDTSGGSFVAGSSQIPVECNAPADGTQDPSITCSFGSIPVGGSRQVAVAIRTPSVASSVTNTATVRIPPSLLHPIADGNPDNDRATVTTDVVDDPDSSAALVREGESLTFQSHVLNVRQSNKGVIASMRAAPADGAVCGTVPCADGVRLDFATDPEYQGVLGVKIDFGLGDPCRGQGEGARCADLYVRKAGDVTLVPRCANEPLASPCVEQVVKVGPALHWIVRMLSTDPDFLPPLGRSSS